MADSSGGHTYKAGTGRIGGHNVVTSSASALPSGGSTTPQNQQQDTIPGQQAQTQQNPFMGQGLGSLFGY